MSRSVGFESIGPAPEDLEAAPIPGDRIKRCQEPHLAVGLPAARAWAFAGRPIPFISRDTRGPKARFGARQGGAPMLLPLRRGLPQSMHQVTQGRGGQRRVFGNDQIHQGIEAGVDLHTAGRGRRLSHGINSRAAVASRHPQQPSVVHDIQ